ncbi:hypothetical protein SEA_LUNA18_5 [Microbacterium phage Luna18]|nr:hypothetical protein SEA_KATCHAN_5 [Microbacterium phage KatChan]URQ04856.1 hypothetical protein SEA_LUNA18_5 [Microbacterium phage Luna18]
MADKNVVLGSVIIDLVATDDGDLIVQPRVEGTIQYVTGMGMLAMAMQDLDVLLADDEDED